MAIIQALLALISRSLGRVLSAVFGWAVVALFGETSRTKKIWLSALVAAAAAWPLLLIGTITPKAAALILAFVPVPGWVPAWTVRAVWITLALAVPLAVGVAVAVRQPNKMRASARTLSGPRHDTIKSSRWAQMARGLPITIGVASAFLIVFVTVPALRITSFIRRRVDLHIPLVTDVNSYEGVAAEVARTLTSHGFEVSPAEPPWWMTAPSRILLWVDRASFATYVPRRFAYYRGQRLEVALYPNALLLRGDAQDAAWAHGVLVEALTATPGLQTFDPSAQDIEKQIRRVWQVYRQNPEAHRHSSALSARLTEISHEIYRLPVTYDEWQIIYRQALQLSRALGGERQLLEQTINPKGVPEHARTLQEEDVMATPIARVGAARAENLSTRELVAEITGKVSLLVKKEVELAKTELKANAEAELAMVKALAAGAVAALLGLNTLLVAVVLALAMKMPGWLAALIVGGVVLVVGVVLGYLGWNWRVTTPLAVTRKTIREDVQWAKERVA
jgi:hypothetical protein